MCTVTFLAQGRGYCLGMNRDEKLTRPAGLPPAIRMVNGRAVVCPSESRGGTWVALNDSGTSLALINWYSAAKRVERDAVSRGEVVTSVASTDSALAADATLRGLPLWKINPFRLIGIFPATHEVFEWRWNLNRLIRKKRPWKAQQWISSGFDEPTAQRVRGRTFKNALAGASGGIDWLRRLHRSHSPQPGPFSTCMHRSDAATVSYTEISVSSNQANLIYHPGPPCETSRAITQLRVCRLRLRMPS
jgi:hypothetical protein